MNDHIVIACLVAIPPTILAIASLIASLRNHDSIQRVQLSINGRLDELLIAEKKSSYEQGHRAAMDSERTTAIATAVAPVPVETPSPDTLPTLTRDR